MRSTIARKALAMVGVAGLGLLVGAAPAFAATEGKAYSKAEVINGSVLGVGVSPVKIEYPPGGTIQQPTIDLGIARLDLVGAGASAIGDASKGQSKAEVNYADAKLTVGIPGGPRVEVTEAALDVVCTADGGVLKGGMNLASVKVAVALLPGAPLVNVPVAVDLGKQTGVQLPGGLGEVLINKQTEKDGVITVTALSVNVLGAQGVSLEFGKVTCGPNIPEPVTPIGDPVGLGAGGLAMASVVGIGLYRRNKRSALEVS